MYYGTIKKYDIANGPGVRVSLFVSAAAITARAVSMRRRGISDMDSYIQKRRRKRF